MKTSQMYQSRYLKMSDFPTPVVLTMTGIKFEEMGGGQEKRWVLYFGEMNKGMVLNATKIKQLEGTFGEETDHWVGRKIKAKPDPGRSMNGRITGGIELIMPTPRGPGAAAVPLAPPPPPPPTAVAASDGFDDEIPF